MNVSLPALTEREQQYCDGIADRINRIRSMLNERSLGSSVEPSDWYDFLAALKQIQGNASNDVSFIATILAKHYLIHKHGVSFCAAEKPQGAPGVDIDVLTREGERVVGEIKTTMPYQAGDFGAQQAVMFRKDFAKLAAAGAKYKYLFVTERATFDVLRKPKYLRDLEGVTIVLLRGTEEFRA